MAVERSTPHEASRRSSGWAAWTRVSGAGTAGLDLLHARIVRPYAPHLHEEFALGVCTGGREVIDYRGSRHRAGPGSVVVVGPGEPHTGGPDGSDGFTYRVLYPPTDLVDGLLGRGDAAPPHFPDLVFDDPGLAGALARVHSDLCRPAGADGQFPWETDSRLVELLAALVARHAAPGGRPARPSRSPSVGRPVMDRLAEQVTSPPSLAQVAGELGLSRFQLLRAFREEVGMPPYAWLAQHRVARARILLERGARPAEVASRVGFADQAHLTRWFRRVVGVTPAAYRNSVQDSHPVRPEC